MEQNTATRILEGLTEALASDLPGVTFGYIGNVESWGDDRSWRIFLPHPGRVGTTDDSVCIGSTDALADALARWPEYEAEARRQYHDGSLRISIPASL